jgi:hypothetical protein
VWSGEDGAKCTSSPFGKKGEVAEDEGGAGG